MRNFVWSVVAACLVATGLGVAHFALTMRGQHTVSVRPGPAGEEQEAPRAAFVPLPHSTPSVDKLLEALEILEPIVVEGAPADPPPAPEFGGVALPGKCVRVVALEAQQAPRPDEQPDQRQQMPYAADIQHRGWFVARLWQALTNLVGGSETGAAGALNETDEPPAGEEQSEPMPVKTSLPPVVDYHYHQQQMHCPYTGHCPIPLYPRPRPAAPESK